MRDERWREGGKKSPTDLVPSGSVPDGNRNMRPHCSASGSGRKRVVPWCVWEKVHSNRQTLPSFFWPWSLSSGEAWFGMDEDRKQKEKKKKNKALSPTTPSHI